MRHLNQLVVASGVEGDGEDGLTGDSGWRVPPGCTSCKLPAAYFIIHQVPHNNGSKLPWNCMQRALDILMGPILPAQELVMRSPGWHSDTGRYNDGGSDGSCGAASERCSEAWDVLSRLRRRPPLCWSPGSSVERSRLIQGVVLHQLPCSQLMLPALEG